MTFAPLQKSVESLTQVFNELAADATLLAIAVLTLSLVVAVMIRPLPYIGSHGKSMTEEVVKAGIILSLIPLLLQVLPKFIADILSTAQ